MSCFLKSASETTIKIEKVDSIANVNYYEILINCGHVNWTVKRRYKDFDELNEKLVYERSLSKDLLPPKKIIGSKTPNFLEKRRNDLEKYLKDVFIFLKLTMPIEFVEFLDFHKYDIIFLLQNLAKKLFLFNNESFLSNRKHYNFSIFELYAITERIHLPCPPPEYQEKIYDFSHILDFCTKLTSIIITTKHLNNISNINPFSCECNANIPTDDTNNIIINNYHNLLKLFNQTIANSNICLNQLKYDLNIFKCLKILYLLNVNVNLILTPGVIRNTLEILYCNNTNLIELKQLLLCDDIHKDLTLIDENDETKIWHSLHTADFSNNYLKDIDKSVNFLKNVKNLIFDGNQIEKITNLTNLTLLTKLSLCNNKFTTCIDWHIELGNIKILLLSQNMLKSLKYFQKMYSLVTLDLSCNLINDIDEVDFIANLPCLENLVMTGNPVAGSVDYRPRVLSRFGDRSHEICLDNEKGSQQELDMALVLSALRSASISAAAAATSIPERATATTKASTSSPSRFPTK